eukprot:CAMPEP_0202961452 /NCGR_PEP_ID=MMETSP1396-20130829/5507_1 /ASSEMBLY_ACC=CAM_ASM_000872 /TAXON_ID= /ORGANISM="Pseudokeronopsis sp., Strain Brazil" /LENGTH=154 /DNA_ID=CAMNT_0049681275 /DNA_START=934 /DNA_END=1398 /DNA_ORIENTATION=-
MIVSETEEELYSDESEKKTRGKKKGFFSLSQFSRLMNKKIYSDEFEMSFESKLLNKRFKMGSIIDCPINEDIECEDQDNYLSDNSSSSTFSFHKRKMNFSLTKLIDKSEPSADHSVLLGSKNYGININETIQEEEDENAGEKLGIISLEMLSKL